MEIRPKLSIDILKKIIKGDEVGNIEYMKLQLAGIALNECFTEVSANRASSSRTKNDFLNSNFYTNSYTSITFSVDLLAASLGLTEKELLKSGLSGRENLMEKICSKFPIESREEAINLFDKFEQYLTNMHKSLYIQRAMFEKEQYKENLKLLIGTIYDLGYLQISSSKQPSTPEYMSELIFRSTKIQNIIDRLETPIDSRYSFDKRLFSQDLIDEVKAGNSKSKSRFLDKITELYKKNPENAMTTKEYYQDYVWREDYDSGKQWDNSICQSFKDVLQSKKVKESIVDKIKKTFKQIREQPLELKPAKDHIKLIPRKGQEEINKFDEEIKVNVTPQITKPENSLSKTQPDEDKTDDFTIFTI